MIQTILTSICSNLSGLFKSGELAYLTLQGKNEMQIRDRVAWELQQELDKRYPNKYMVRREWNSKNKSRVDLAVLEITMNWTIKKVVAIIEFKAHSCFNICEQWPYYEFAKDVVSMNNVCNNNGYCDDQTEMYYIFLQACLDKIAIRKHAGITYSGKANIYGAQSNQDLKMYFDGFFVNPFILNQKKPCPTKYLNLVNTQILLRKQLGPNSKFQLIGNSFGYDVYVAPMIWGPVKRTEITIVP